MEEVLVNCSASVRTEVQEVFVLRVERKGTNFHVQVPNNWRGKASLLYVVAGPEGQDHN